MKYQTKTLGILRFFLACMLVLVGGCRSPRTFKAITNIQPSPQVQAIVYSRSESSDLSIPLEIPGPMTNLAALPNLYWEMSLDQAIQLALKDTDILRSLGASVVTNVSNASGSFDPAIQYSDPVFGIQAALADFDTGINSNLLFAKNDDVFNNPVFGGGASEVREDLTTSTFGLNKIGPSGTRFSLGSSVEHSQSNNSSLLFSNAWTTVWEATARQPLLQGRGVRFNRIAGPNGQPGFRNSSGIIVSRINHDISIAVFEKRFREMITEITDAYWKLSLAYRNLDAVKGIRDISESTWKVAKTKYQEELPGGEADREAQAREQYYQFQSQFVAALNGNRRTGQNGVLQAEANLRRLLKLPQSDDRLIKPADEPASAKTIYDWKNLATDALTDRVEIREQMSRIKQRQLEVEASKNFLLPRLDAVATYRNNGFGDDLAGGGNARFASALGDALSNDHGEWELGFSYDMTVGYRRAHAAVRNSELAYCREKAILAEQQEQIIHDLGSAIRSVDQGYTAIELNNNRLEAARNTVDARTAAYGADAVGFEELLDSHRRLLEAKITFHEIVIEYELSKEEVMVQSGRLLSEHGISLVEENFCSTCQD